jgi:KaiC/GvpD/RAD55 family RecA-like ATPase
MKDSVERIKTGIFGLDKIIEGGFPRNSLIIVSGGPGSGKSIFCLQYIYYGAKNNESGLYITLEEDPNDLKEAAKKLGMDFDKLKNCKIIKPSEIKDYPDLQKIIEEEIKSLNAKRLVIDSLSSLEALCSTFESAGKGISLIRLREGYKIPPEKRAIIRRFLYNFVHHIKSLGVTAILTSEIQNAKYSPSGITEYLVDGIIKLEYEAVGNIVQRSIFIPKMRKTNIKAGRLGMEIGKGGIKVLE